MRLFDARTVTGEIRLREIRLVLHSTHLYTNLPRILRDRMLYTAGKLRELYGPDEAARLLHDPNRYEHFAVGLDYLNASLSQPNAPLLYRRSRSDWKNEWVHLALDPDLLKDSHTLFCSVSAAAGRGKYLHGGLLGLRSMFAPEVQGETRHKLPANVPTHPQAEVLIMGSLPLDRIQAIIVPEAGVGLEVQRLAEHYGVAVRVDVLPHLFIWPERLTRR